MLTEQDKATCCALFDSFCRTILRNEMRNFYKKYVRQEHLERLSDDPAMYQRAEDAATDDHPSDHLYIVYRGKPYILDNETLCRAMRELPEQQLGVLILGYWQGWSDKQIAKAYDVSDRTIRNLRNRAFREIRRWFI